MSTFAEPVYPNAPARLVRKPQGYLWIVDQCPFCHQRHVHGGGPIGGDPYGKLSHRVADCIKRPIPQPGGYILVAAPGHEAP